jgi:hypothetical protein
VLSLDIVSELLFVFDCKAGRSSRSLEVAVSLSIFMR